MLSVDAFISAFIDFIQTDGSVYLVSTPGKFVLFVAVGTVGAVVGSLLVYSLFGVNGDRAVRNDESHRSGSCFVLTERSGTYLRYVYYIC